MKTSDLFIRALEAEGVDSIYGIRKRWSLNHAIRERNRAI